jgi:glyoxylase-like metal-dependent hydrolase (beta-lactamase superfamily II)
MPIQTLAVGRFELTSIPVQPESVRPVPQFFPTADLEALEPLRNRLPDAFGESASELRFAQSLCLLRDDSDITLVDAGLPPTKEDWALMRALIELEIKPEDVTRVFITHRDADHIGGLSDRRKRDGGITFRNAKHYISSVEWNDFSHDEARREWFENNLRPIQQAGLLEIIEAHPLEGILNAPEFAPGLKAVFTPGHRSGGSSLLVDNAALLTADVLHAPFQVTHPEVSITFDHDKESAAQTRASVVNAAEAHGWIVHIPHYPPFGLGHVTRGDDGRMTWETV